MRPKKPPPPKKEERSGRSSPTKSTSEAPVPTTSSSSINKLTLKRQAIESESKTTQKSLPSKTASVATTANKKSKLAVDKKEKLVSHPAGLVVEEKKAPQTPSKNMKDEPSAKTLESKKPQPQKSSDKSNVESASSKDKTPVSQVKLKVPAEKKSSTVIKKKTLPTKKGISKKLKNQIKNQRMTNELKNLGVNLLDHSFCSESSSSDSRQSFDVKASICEMVKTKSRASVCQSSLPIVAKAPVKKVIKKDEPSSSKNTQKPVESKLNLITDKSKPSEKETKSEIQSQKVVEKPEDGKVSKINAKKPVKKPEVENCKVPEKTIQPGKDESKPKTESSDQKKEESKKPTVAKKPKVVKEKLQKSTKKDANAQNDKTDSKHDNDKLTDSEGNSQSAIKEQKKMENSTISKKVAIKKKVPAKPTDEKGVGEKNESQEKFNAIEQIKDVAGSSSQSITTKEVPKNETDVKPKAQKKPKKQLDNKTDDGKLTQKKVAKKTTTEKLEKVEHEKVETNEKLKSEVKDVQRVAKKKKSKDESLEADGKAKKARKSNGKPLGRPKKGTEETPEVEKTLELPTQLSEASLRESGDDKQSTNKTAKTDSQIVDLTANPVDLETKNSCPTKKKKLGKELSPEEMLLKKQKLLEKRRQRAAVKRAALKKVEVISTETTPSIEKEITIEKPPENPKIFVKNIESLLEPSKASALPSALIIVQTPIAAVIEVISLKSEEEKDSEKEDSRPLSSFTSTSIKTEAASTTALPEFVECIGKPESPKNKRKYVKKSVEQKIETSSIKVQVEVPKNEESAKKSLLDATKKEDIYEFHDSGSDALSPMPITKKPPFKPTKKSMAAETEKNKGNRKEKEILEAPKKKVQTPKKEPTKKVQPDKKDTKKISKKQSDTEQSSDSDSESSDSDGTSKTIKTRLLKKRVSAKNRKILLYGFWKGPKRHRVASLNAIAKVHCLYENESRVALEQSLIKAAKIASLKDAAKLQHASSSENDEEDDNDISVTKRSLRTAPGLRGIGKLWEFDDSSLSSAEEANSDSEQKMKNKLLKDKKKKSSKKSPVSSSKSSKTSHSLASKSKLKKSKIKKLKKITKRSESDRSKDDRSSDSEDSDRNHSKKRKHPSSDIPSDFKDVGVRKRMASLNASAMLAASYEVERHCGRDSDSSYESDSSTEIPPTPKKVKELKKEEVEEVRPVSTNLVIVQDTDVTITGMYVNSSAGSSQESYCKMQYRVQSSVTEERVVRASSQEAPKSYTPLTALSSMRPPGSQESSLSASSSQCESSVDNPPMGFPPPQPPYPPPAHHMPPSLVASSTSAFCAPPATPHNHHHDPTGYYQPAGPLISSHLLQQQQQPPSQLSNKVNSLDSEGHPLLQQPPPPTSTADSTDSDVLITGGDLTPRPQTFHYGPQSSGLYARPSVHQMHCPTYPPNYYPYAQHPQEMCYPQPYQPYYPQKVYPSTPPQYRRYMPGPYYTHAQGPPPPSELYEQPPPSSAPPPPNQSQLVPAGPSGPQHMDHYPYYGYSPGPGGQCYSRPPYMDAPTYPNTCPCPMQSCPKNVHTGPLIGSNKTKTNKGPVSTNHHIVANTLEPIVAVSTTPTSTTTASIGTQAAAKKVVLCKQEEGSDVLDNTSIPALGSIKIKGENGVSSSNKPTNIHPHHISGHLHSYHHGGEQIFMPQMRPSSLIAPKEGMTYEKIALAPLPNYALNNNVSEPELSVSPARGSTGLSLPQMQAEATQPIIETGSFPPRRPRIGKSTERDRIMMIHGQPTTESTPTSPSTPTHQSSYEPHLTNSFSSLTSNSTINHNNTNLAIVKQEFKIEDTNQIFKTENLSDCESMEKTPPRMEVPLKVVVTTPTKTGIDKFSIDALIDKSTSPPKRLLLLPKYDDDVCEVINLDDTSSPLPENPLASLKRRKLLANINVVKQPKKSPPNSYKNLIKRPESRGVPYIDVDADDDVVETETTPSPVSITLKKFKALRKKKKKRKKNAVLKLKPRLVGISKKAKKNNKKLRKVAEKEIKEHRDREEKLAKLKQMEMQVESLDIKPVIAEIQPMETDACLPKSMTSYIFKTNIENTIDMVAKGYFSEPEGSTIEPRVLKKLKSLEKPRSKSLTKKEKPAQLMDSGVDETEREENETTVVEKAQKSRIHRSKSQPDETHNSLVNINNNTINVTDDGVDGASKKFKSSKVKKLKVKGVAEGTEEVANNNNENELKIVQTIGAHVAELATALAESKQTCTDHEGTVDEVEHRQTKVPAARKRSKSRSSKFSNRKRHRPSLLAEVEQPVVPRKSNTVPRWSNGWSWEGQSFQGKVFLNSDDLPVIRTCYSAMRHASGDIIRPRDSVLLRAGGKKGQELPYVAKVAYLWENPEDGEMMMSLLWYYRPEHTEQGRQPNDDVCEVFASRHKDHNSVACIEDKCYVLTYNEYCRYRRRLRMFEENIEETPSIVPPLISRDYSRPQVPVQTPTDLVMYCRRVYEFRLKRMLKQPNGKD